MNTHRRQMSISDIHATSIFSTAIYRLTQKIHSLRELQGISDVPFKGTR